MNSPTSLWNKIQQQLSPIVHLSNNPLSLAGVVVVTAATVFWVFLLPISFKGDVQHPYIGILAFLLLPGAFFLGLAIIPIGMYLRRRRERKLGVYPASFP